MIIDYNVLAESVICPGLVTALNASFSCLEQRVMPDDARVEIETGRPGMLRALCPLVSFFFSFAIAMLQVLV